MIPIIEFSQRVEAESLRGTHETSKRMWTLADVAPKVTQLCCTRVQIVMMVRATVAKVVATFTARWGRMRRLRGALPTAHWRHRDLHTGAPFIPWPRQALRTHRTLARTLAAVTATPEFPSATYTTCVKRCRNRTYALGRGRTTITALVQLEPPIICSIDQKVFSQQNKTSRRTCR